MDVVTWVSGPVNASECMVILHFSNILIHFFYVLHGEGHNDCLQQAEDS